MKKLLALILALTLCLGLAACAPAANNPPASSPPASPSASEPAPPSVDPNDLAAIDWGNGSTVTLKVWGAQDDQTMLGEMVDAFKAKYAATKWDITFGVVGEPDTKTKYLEDPAAAADVFAFANDQLRDLVAAGGLYEVGGVFKDGAIAENGVGSVGSATLNDKLWAFPMTADNGYFMYYDTSVISADAVKSLDAMLDAAQAAGKKVFMDVSNGWYIASFFLGAGGKLELDADGNQTCDFNNANGVAAGEVIKALTAHPAFITGDDTVFTGGIADGSIAAGVSGMWNAGDIEAALGANYGATKLPTMTLDGKQVQMSSFGGYKLVGVNSQTQFPDAAMLLAQWLTNEENQLKRFNDRQMGPSNSKIAADPAVLANKALAALALQGAYAVSQNDVLGNYWAPAEAFGTAMEAKDYSTPIQDMLNAMVVQITTAS